MTETRADSQMPRYRIQAWRINFFIFACQHQAHQSIFIHLLHTNTLFAAFVENVPCQEQAFHGKRILGLEFGESVHEAETDLFWAFPLILYQIQAFLVQLFDSKDVGGDCFHRFFLI